MPNSAGSKKAAALSRGTHVERKEFRRRIRLTYRKELSFSLTYIVYQIFWLVQIFIGFFLPAMDGGGMTRDFVLLAEFLPAIFAKKRSGAYFAQPGDALRKSLFFHKYSLTQNMSNYKWKIVSDTFSISYFLQNTTAKPQKLPAAYKKTGRNKCSL